MPTTTDKRGGFTMISNVILDDPKLCARDKLVLCSLIRHAYGKKVKVYPSQLRLAKLLGLNVKTVRAALASLTDLNYIKPHGHGKPGATETYTLDLSAQRTYTCPIDGQEPVQPADTNKSKQKDELNKTLAATSANAGTVVDHPPERETSSNAVLYQRPVHSADRLTKAEVNENRLTPEGLPVNGNIFDLDYGVNTITLPTLDGTWLTDGVIQELVELRGVEFCQMWEAWLPRKIAYEYEKGRPVKSAAGLYRRAIEEGWQVDPAWPEHDETKHRCIPASVVDNIDDIDDEDIPW